MFANLFGSLAFLATLLGLAVGIVVLIFTLATRRTKIAGRIALGMAAWIGLYAALLLTVSFTSTQRVLEAGQEHCYDEMCFSVQNVTTSQTLGAGNQAVRAAGIYYVVTVQLRNDAKRVAQKPSDPALWVVDQQGKRYDGVSATGNLPGQAIDPTLLWNQKLQAGESQSRTLAFDLPFGTANPLLVITEGGGPTFLIIGDENSPFHAKTVFQLAK
jgi:hypothetical protein